MKKPIIGISANEILDSGETLHNLSVNYVSLGYVRGVQESGGLPLLLPIGTPEDARAYVNQIDKLILTGGQNVSPKLFGQEIQTQEDHTYLPRDEFELALIDEALQQNKPIFGVCRGLQLLNVALGGDLQQVLEDQGVKHMQDPVPREVPTHAVQTAEGSLLNRLYGKMPQVNSFHFQGIGRLADELTATAWSSDNVVEGIENAEKRILGVQWHPDFAYEAIAQELGTFDFVVNQL